MTPLEHKTIVTKFVSELNEELVNILRFWMEHAIDEMNGGFAGKIDHDNHVYAGAPKGCVLNARILWTFSAAHTVFKLEQYKAMADRAFQYIKKYFIDDTYGGVFWSVDHHGHARDTKKQIYALAFVLYGCSEYYRAFKNTDAKELALALYQCIETYSYDRVNGGYHEAFTREWQPIADLRLSEKDANEKKTMNTHLHVLEAYTNLYRIAPDKQVRQSIIQLLGDFEEHIINPENSHLHLFMDEHWHVKGQGISYGHDVEAAWLLMEAADVIGDARWIQAMRKNAVKMAEAAAEGLDQDGGLWYEKEANHVIKEKHWWPQAEALVGFVNAWQLTGEEQYLNQAFRVWAFIKRHMIDRKKGEWYWGIRSDYTVMHEEDKAGMWKCPYHNGRACLEVIRRLS